MVLKSAFIGIAVKYQRAFLHPNWGDFKDIRSIQPEKAVLILVDECRAEETMKLDLTQEPNLSRFQGILNDVESIIVHEMNEFLFALWSLNLKVDTRKVFSTWVLASCLLQGEQRRIHGHTEGDFEDDPAEIIKDQEAANREWMDSLRLTRLKTTSATNPGEGPTAPTHHPKNNVDAQNGGRVRFNKAPCPFADLVLEVNLLKRVYRELLNQAEKRGMVNLLHVIESPYAVSTAWTQWNGIQISTRKLEELQVRCRKSISTAKWELKQYGLLDNPTSSGFLDLLTKLDLNHHFEERTKQGRISLRKSILKEKSKLHPAIKAYRQYASAKRILDCWVKKLPLGRDSRVHPAYLQNAAVTGRTSIVRPAIVNMDRNLRPLVMAPDEKVLLEFDYRSFDLAVAAARFNEPELLELYHTHEEPYREIIKRYFPDLSPASAKNFVLGFLYGKTKRGVSKDFSISIEAAESLVLRLEAAFPNLTSGMQRYIKESIEQGYASIVPGMHRHLPSGRRMSPGIKRSIGNTAVQGAAASIFKMATAMVYDYFKGSETLIVLQCHDALLIETPADTAAQVYEVVKRLMRDAGQYFFPELNLRAECKAGPQRFWGNVETFDALLSVK